MNSSKAFAVNRGSRSDIIESGIPNRGKRLSTNSWAMSSWVAVFTVGMNITPFVSPWSTTDRIASHPSLSGKSVIRSIEQFAKGLSDFAPSMGISAGFTGDRFILNSWHVAQPLT